MNYDEWKTNEPDYDRYDAPDDERQLCPHCEADLDQGEPHALDCLLLWSVPAEKTEEAA